MRLMILLFLIVWALLVFFGNKLGHHILAFYSASPGRWQRRRMALGDLRKVPKKTYHAQI